MNFFQSILGVHISQLIFVNFYKKKTTFIFTDNLVSASISAERQEGREELPGK